MTIVSLQPPDVKVLTSKPVCLNLLWAGLIILGLGAPLALNTSFLINFSRESVQKGESNQGKNFYYIVYYPAMFSSL